MKAADQPRHQSRLLLKDYIAERSLRAIMSRYYKLDYVRMDEQFMMS